MNVQGMFEGICPVSDRLYAFFVAKIFSLKEEDVHLGPVTENFPVHVLAQHRKCFVGSDRGTKGSGREY